MSELPAAASFDLPEYRGDPQTHVQLLMRAVDTWQTLSDVIDQELTTRLARAQGNRMAAQSAVIQAVTDALGRAGATWLRLQSDLHQHVGALLAQAWERAALAGALPAVPAGQEPVVIYQRPDGSAYAAPISEPPTDAADVPIYHAANMEEATPLLGQFSAGAPSATPPLPPQPIQPPTTGPHGSYYVMLFLEPPCAVSVFVPSGQQPPGTGQVLYGPYAAQPPADAAAAQYNAQHGLCQGSAPPAAPPPPATGCCPVTVNVTNTPTPCCPAEPSPLNLTPSWEPPNDQAANVSFGAAEGDLGGFRASVNLSAPVAVGDVLYPDWNSPEVCGQLQQLVDKAGDFDPKSICLRLGLYVQADDGSLRPQTPDWLQGFNAVQLPTNLVPPLKVLIAALSPAGAAALIGDVIGRALTERPTEATPVTLGIGDVLAAVLRQSIDAVSDAVQALGSGKGLALSQANYFRALVVVMRLIQGWTRIDLGDLIRTLEYGRAYWSPTFLPDQGAVNACFHSGEIDADTWECWTKANDRLPDPARRLRDSGRSKPNVGQAIEAYRRGLITAVERDELVRRQGYTRESERSLVFAISTPLPGSNESLPWWQRGQFSPETVKRYGFDEGEQAWLDGATSLWLKATGLHESTLRQIFRGRWVLPNLSELVEAQRRLRNGRVDPSLVVSGADVEYTLKAQGVPPFWRDRLQAIFLPTLTFRQLERAYLQGSLTRKQLLDGLLDLGYTGEQADILAGTYDTLQAQTIERSKWTKLYQSAGIGFEGAFRELTSLGYSEGTVKNVLSDAQREQAARDQVTVVAAYHKRFLHGDVDLLTAQALLSQLGLAADQVQALLTTWQAELSARGKEVNASELCTWMGSGLISADEAATRLAMLGYSPADIRRILAKCAQGISQRRAAAAAKSAAAAERLAQKQQRDQATVERQAAAAAKARAAKAAKIVSTKERLTRQRLAVAQHLSQLMQISINDAQAKLQSEHDRIIPQYHLDDQEAWATLAAALKRLAKGPPATWPQVVDDAAGAEEGLLAHLGQPAGSNGTGGYQ